MMTLLTFVFFMQSSVLALGPQEVVGSSLKHYPKVLASVLSVEETQNKERASRGVFDGKIKGEMDSRTEGFYDGDFYKGQIEKPIPYLNSKIYGGLRQSYKTFPSYEGKMVTGDGGEAFLGLSLSLLRNSLIDSSRGKIKKLQQDVYQAQVGLEQVRIHVQTLALQSYWSWVVASYEVRVYRDILGLAEKRAVQISKRIRAGDLARIYASENDQYIQKRKAQLAQAFLKSQSTSLYLSLFYRDQNGKPVLPSESMLPAVEESLPLLKEREMSLYEEALSKSLKLKEIQSKMEQADIDLRLGRNELLPKVDLNFEWNQDQGRLPSSTLLQDENRIMLKIEVPIEYRKGLGKKKAADLKKQQLSMQAQLAREKLKAKIRELALKRNAYSQIYEISKKQKVLARQLAKAELRKFKQGASDLILVNIREENLAEARVKNLRSLLKYHIVESEILRELVQFVK